MSRKARWPPHRGVSLGCTGSANERGLAGRVFDLSLSTAGPQPYFETVTPSLQRFTPDKYETHFDLIMQTGSHIVSAAFPSVRFRRKRKQRNSTAERQTTIS